MCFVMSIRSDFIAASKVDIVKADLPFLFFFSSFFSLIALTGVCCGFCIGAVCLTGGLGKAHDLVLAT